MDQGPGVAGLLGSRLHRPPQPAARTGRQGLCGGVLARSACGTGRFSEAGARDESGQGRGHGLLGRAGRDGRCGGCMGGERPAQQLERGDGAQERDRRHTTHDDEQYREPLVVPSREPFTRTQIDSQKMSQLSPSRLPGPLPEGPVWSVGSGSKIAIHATSIPPSSKARPMDRTAPRRALPLAQLTTCWAGFRARTKHRRTQRPATASRRKSPKRTEGRYYSGGCHSCG